MKLMMKLPIALLAFSLALGAQEAQEVNRPHVKVGTLFTAMGQLKGMTGKNTAPNFEVGYTFHNAADLGIDVVPYAGYLLINGLTDKIVRLDPANYVIFAGQIPESTDQYYKVSAWRFGLDMVWAKGSIFGQGVNFRTGPVLQNFIGEGARIPTTLPGKRWQIGWRIGTDVTFSSKFFASLELTASEWRSNPSELRVVDRTTSTPRTVDLKVPDINPNNPVYGAFMVGMRF